MVVSGYLGVRFFLRVLSIFNSEFFLRRWLDFWNKLLLCNLGLVWELRSVCYDVCLGRF